MEKTKFEGAYEAPKVSLVDIFAEAPLCASVVAGQAGDPLYEDDWGII